MRFNSDRRKILSNLTKKGWVIHYGRKHGKLISPNGRRIIFSKTPSDRNAVRNLEKDIRSVEAQEPTP